MGNNTTADDTQMVGQFDPKDLATTYLVRS